MKNWRADFKRRGLCSRCGGDRDNVKYAMCSKCRKQRKGYYHTNERGTEEKRLASLQSTRVMRKRWMEQGLCSRCGKEIDDKKYAQCTKCRKQSRDHHRSHDIGTVKNGKQVTFRNVLKRPYPEDEKCELCGRDKTKDNEDLRKHWHHWDDEKDGHGIWACPQCHLVCDLEEEGLLDKVVTNLRLWKKKYKEE